MANISCLYFYDYCLQDKRILCFWILISSQSAKILTRLKEKLLEKTVEINLDTVYSAMNDFSFADQ